MFNEIVNPKTGRKVNINSNIGKNILKKYIKYYKTMMIGGKSHLVGDWRPPGRYHYLDQLADYWWYTLGKTVWWSEGQSGYYFTNLSNRFMSQTHIHIYKLIGNTYYFSAKFKNIQVLHGSTFIANSIPEAGYIVTTLCHNLFQGKPLDSGL